MNNSIDLVEGAKQSELEEKYLELVGENTQQYMNTPLANDYMQVTPVKSFNTIIETFTTYGVYEEPIR